MSSNRSAPDPTHVPMAHSMRTRTFVMASPMQNESVQNENTDNLMGGPSFYQLAMQIMEPLSQVGPITGYNFIVDDKDDEEEPVEVPFDSDNGSDGVTKPNTQSQPSRT